MTDLFSKTGLFGSIAATLTAFCCVLPMALMVAGLSGSWFAFFGAAAAASLYISAASVVLVIVAWILAARRRASARTYTVLGAGSILTATAWAVILNEAAINDYLITLM